MARVGIGPILKIGKNQKAPPFSAHQIDQALMPHSWFCKNGMILRRARRAYWHLKKRLAARLAVGNVVTAECPLLGEQRKTFAQFVIRRGV